jgi:transcriptional regulator with XRE-family HTH domain
MGKKNHKSKRLLAANVRRLRRDKEWSQHDLAAEAKVRQALISEIELGDANPTVTSLEKIAAALDVKVKNLFEC